MCYRRGVSGSAVLVEDFIPDPYDDEGSVGGK